MANSLSLTQSLQTNNNRHNPSLKNPDSHKIVEAQGWIDNKNSDVILVAQALPREFFCSLITIVSCSVTPAKD